MLVDPSNTVEYLVNPYEVRVAVSTEPLVGLEVEARVGEGAPLTEDVAGVTITDRDSVQCSSTHTVVVYVQVFVVKVLIMYTAGM